MRISDWSSDVCSSDLGSDRLCGRDLTGSELGVDAGHVLADLTEAGDVVELAGGVLEAEVEELLLGIRQRLHQAGIVEVAERSEERRVGKEGVRTCRSGWSSDHSKKNKKT